MKSKSLIITWITACDYPIFRRWLKRYCGFFDEIIITWSEHFRHMKYDKFIEESLKHIPNIKFIPFKEYEYGIADWRNVSTNRMLDTATGDWIISIEQDFFAKDWDKLLKAVTEASKTYDFLGYKGYQKQQSYQDYLSGNYVHPAFWFMKRETLEKTSKDFTADTSKGCDHFGLITQDVERLNIPIWYTQEHGFPEETTFHQGGINMNYLEFGKEDFVLHRPELFYVYNYWSMKVIPQDPEFLELCKEVDKQLKIQFPNINPEINEWSIFYK